MEISYNEFEKEFIKRTQALIDSYTGETEFTLLINCLLGLIILPHEKARWNRYLKTKLNDVPDLIDCLNESGEFIFKPTKKDGNEERYIESDKTLTVFLKKMRNAFAHFNLKPINDKGKWIGITIKDVNIKNKNNVELQVTLKYEQIKKIAEYISSAYLRETLKKLITEREIGVFYI